jgi:uncharacterized protein YwqG
MYQKAPKQFDEEVAKREESLSHTIKFQSRVKSRSKVEGWGYLSSE